MEPKCETLIISFSLDWFMYVLSLNPIISQEITFIGQWKRLSNVCITKINVWEREAELIHDEWEWYLNVAVGQWSPYRHLEELSDLHRIQSCVNTLPLALSAVGINSFSCLFRSNIFVTFCIEFWSWFPLHLQYFFVFICKTCGSLGSIF